MPLSQPVEREQLHHRSVSCCGYQRSDGLWDIEGHLVDTKSHDYHTTFKGEVRAGTAVHDMWMRLTIDPEMVIRAVEVKMDHFPYPTCNQIESNFQRLVGLQIKPGFRREARARVGGVAGCTHLVELLGPVATTAYQTLSDERDAENSEANADPGAPLQRPYWLDSCYSHASSSAVTARLWPSFYIAGPGPKRR